MNTKLIEHIEKNIFPLYDKYYSHGVIHINNVIKNILILADYYNLDKNICYTIAAYHDIGLRVDRDNHEYESGKLLVNDKILRTFFDEDQILLMKEAVEDHRGSRKDRPRSFYGEVLSDSDRDFDIEVLADRQLSVSLKNYPLLKTFDEHFERSYNYTLNRNNNSKGIHLWTDNPILIQKRTLFEQIYLDKELCRKYYKEAYDKLVNVITIDKLQNYYEDC